MSFPDSSAGKEPACKAGDHGSIPGLGRSAGEKIGYPLQYSWPSLVAQLVKNLAIMWLNLTYYHLQSVSLIAVLIKNLRLTLTIKMKRYRSENDLRGRIYLI